MTELRGRRNGRDVAAVSLVREVQTSPSGVVLALVLVGCGGGGSSGSHAGTGGARVTAGTGGVSSGGRGDLGGSPGRGGVSGAGGLTHAGGVTGTGGITSMTGGDGGRAGTRRNRLHSPGGHDGRRALLHPARRQRPERAQGKGSGPSGTIWGEYNDEGSAYLTETKNVYANFGAYVTANANSSNNTGHITFTNNWGSSAQPGLGGPANVVTGNIAISGDNFPADAQAVVDAAGLESAYVDLKSNP